MKQRAKCITEKELYRLIESHPSVDAYTLNTDQIKAVLEGYAKVLVDALELDVEVPFPNLGTFYSQPFKYGGGYSNLTFPPKKIAPREYKKFRFRPTKEIEEKFKGELNSGISVDDTD